jgi:hypothetical protein
VRLRASANPQPAFVNRLIQSRRQSAPPRIRLIVTCAEDRRRTPNPHLQRLIRAATAPPRPTAQATGARVRRRLQLHRAGARAAPQHGPGAAASGHGACRCGPVPPGSHRRAGRDGVGSGRMGGRSWRREEARGDAPGSIPCVDKHRPRYAFHGMRPTPVAAVAVTGFTRTCLPHGGPAGGQPLRRTSGSGAAAAERRATGGGGAAAGGGGAVRTPSRCAGHGAAGASGFQPRCRSSCCSHSVWVGCVGRQRLGRGGQDDGRWYFWAAVSPCGASPGRSSEAVSLMRGRRKTSSLVPTRASRPAAALGGSGGAGGGGDEMSKYREAVLGEVLDK